MRLKMQGVCRRVAAVVGAWLWAAALAGCATQNVSDTGGPLFDASQIAPLEVRVAAAEGGGVAVEVVTRGVGLAEGVLVFTDGETEIAELTGTSATLTSDNTSGLVCVMLQASSKSGDYWYFDNGHDYWYFDSTGAMMTYEEGAQWYTAH